MNSHKRNQFTTEQTNWIAALRSGDYKQDTGFLATDKGYCCLGVLLHTLDPDNGALQPESTGILSDAMGVDFSNLHMHIDGEFVHGQYHDVDDNSVDWFTDLAEINDEGILDFNGIADLLEKTPWVVFTNFDAPSETDKKDEEDA